MPNYTPNLNLEKPLQTETYNIDVHNANSDKIDEASQTHRTAPVLDHPDESVTTEKIAPKAVTTEKIAPKAVTTEKMADSGVSPGSYTKVTVDRTGRVTAGGRPTTLAEAGIEDAYTKAEADQHFVNADGDTMTGPLNLKNARLSCETTDSAGSSIKNDLIRIGTANQYGINVGFGGNGNTIVGSGESVQAMLDWLIGKENEFHEEMYTTADGDCILLSNCQSGISYAKELRFKANGELVHPSGNLVPEMTRTHGSASSNIVVSNGNKLEYRTPAEIGALYSLPAASSSVRGGVKVGAGLSISGDTLSAKDRVHAQGSNYIRYVSGLQLCWDIISNKNITFPVAFKTMPGFVHICSSNDWSRYWDLSTTGVFVAQNNGSYIAVGYWK